VGFIAEGVDEVEDMESGDIDAVSLSLIETFLW
jgi:hypothetical protein